APGRGPPPRRKCPEPVALSSTRPADLPVSLRAFELSFDLLALRARCRGEPTVARNAGQGRPSPDVCNLRRFHRRWHDRVVTPVERLGSTPMHLRMPSIDKGVQAFIWALVFFLYIFFGMKSIAIDGATSLIVALVSSFLIFL